MQARAPCTLPALSKIIAKVRLCVKMDDQPQKLVAWRHRLKQKTLSLVRIVSLSCSTRNLTTGRCPPSQANINAVLPLVFPFCASSQGTGSCCLSDEGSRTAFGTADTKYQLTVSLRMGIEDSGSSRLKLHGRVPCLQPLQGT
jgi:hypothetical protein